MKVLITGSSGQIGTNLASALLRNGREVLGLDCRPNQWTAEFETQLVDLVAVARGKAAYEPPFRPDVIVHLAAHAKVHDLVLNPARALENVEMAAAVFELGRLTKSPVIFGSSREVYGDIEQHVTDESMADFVVAKSPYSASKIAGEALLYSYARCYDLPMLVFRFSNVYGRYDNDLDRMERVIPLFVRKIYDGVPITVYGREKMLDFTYVDDCVSGLMAGISGLAEGRLVNQTLNLAYGQGQTLSDLVTLIELATGRKAKATFEPARPGEVTRYIADISKAAKLLGYRPQTPLTAGIVKYLDWLRQTGWLDQRGAQPGRARSRIPKGAPRVDRVPRELAAPRASSK
jgi:UDP-glucose 4-epimerase